MSDFAATAVFALGLLAVVGAGEGLRRWARWRPEATRRFVHALTGLLLVAAPALFSRPAGIYVLAAAFVAVNAVAVRRGFFPGMHGIRRPSWGTVTFPLALLFALATCWTLDPGHVYVLQTAFLVLAISDPLASLVGMGAQRPGRFAVGTSTKSVAGTIAFFASAYGLAAGALAAWAPYGGAEVLLAALVATALATGAELLGARGWDNFFIVVAVVVPLVVLHEAPQAAPLLALGVLVAVGFAAAAYRARFLTLDGAVAAGGLAWSVLALGGAAWAVPGLTFFVLSSLLSRAGRRRKRAAEALAEKGGRRDAGQVYANGGVAWVLLVAHVFVPHDALYWGYAGAFAAAAADTWGTEIGTFVGGRTRLVWSGRPVPPGTSGGVSVAGTLGALAGAAAVFASLAPFAGPYLGGLGWGTAALLVVVGGFAAALLDSLAGATVQALYRDPAGRLTERRASGSGPHPLVRGRRWITNDRVNLACTLGGALLALLGALVRG